MAGSMGSPGFTNFPGGFAYGITIRGIPILQAQPGSVYWVSNYTTLLQRGCTGGNDGNAGTYQRPFATIQAALNICDAGIGDIIFVKAGHAETIADAATLSLNKAGVAIIGLGVGSARPTLTFSTANTANIPITAANMAIQNFLFKANFLDLASVFTATSTNTPTDLAIEKCEFRDTSAVLNFIALVTGNATANSMDGLRFAQNRVSSLGTTAATTALKILSATDRIQILENFGNWAVLNNTAAMLAGGANTMTNLDFGRNVLNRPNTSSTGGSFISSTSTTCTGHCYDNYMWQLTAAAGIWIATGTKLAFSQNFSPITAAADRSGLINPAAV